MFFPTELSLSSPTVGPDIYTEGSVVRGEERYAIISQLARFLPRRNGGITIGIWRIIHRNPMDQDAHIKLLFGDRS